MDRNQFRTALVESLLESKKEYITNFVFDDSVDACKAKLEDDYELVVTLGNELEIHGKDEYATVVSVKLVSDGVSYSNVGIVDIVGKKGYEATFSHFVDEWEDNVKGKYVDEDELPYDEDYIEQHLGMCLGEIFKSPKLQRRLAKFFGSQNLNECGRKQFRKALSEALVESKDTDKLVRQLNGEHFFVSEKLKNGFELVFGMDGFEDTTDEDTIYMISGSVSLQCSECYAHLDVRLWVFEEHGGITIMLDDDELAYPEWKVSEKGLDVGTMCAVAGIDLADLNDSIVYKLADKFADKYKDKFAKLF